MSKAAWFWGYRVVRKGSSTSGNYGHKGRPGIKGGSMPGGGHGAIGIAGGDYQDVLNQIQAYRDMQKGKEVVKLDRAGQPCNALNTTRDPKANEVFLGDSPDLLEQHHAARLERKLGKLVTKTGLPPKVVEAVLYEWSITSNDSNMDALSVQQEASEMFGIPLSTWQKKRIEEAEPLWKGQEYVSREAKKKLLETIYKDTQDRFQEFGFKKGDTVRLFRGVSDYAPDAEVGENMLLQQNTISSWSMNFLTARNFGVQGDEGFVLGMDVPVENIFSLGSNGLGTVHEGEFVIFGVPGSQAVVMDKKTWG